MSDREKTKALVVQLHEIARTGADRLIEKLNDPKAKIQAWQLNAITGTAIDKIAKYENWEKKGSGEAGEWVKALVSGLQAAGGGRVSLEVETLPPRVEPTTLDVGRVDGLIEASAQIRHRENATPEQLAHIREKDREKRQRYVERKRIRQEFVVEAGEESLDG